MSIAVSITRAEAARVSKAADWAEMAGTAHQDGAWQLFRLFYDASRTMPAKVLSTLYIPTHLADTLWEVRETMTREGVGTRQPVAGVGSLVQRLAEGLLLQGRSVVRITPTSPLIGSTYR